MYCKQTGGGRGKHIQTKATTNWLAFVDWEGKKDREMRGESPLWLYSQPLQITIAPVFLLKFLLCWLRSLLNLLIWVCLETFPHGERIKQYGCMPHGWTVLEVVDHSRVEDVEVYRVMTLPGLHFSHCTCSGVRGCFPVLCHVPFLKRFSSAIEVALST